VDGYVCVGSRRAGLGRKGEVLGCGQQRAGRTMGLVRVYRYAVGSTWNGSDMISIDVSMWQRLYSGHTGETPVFVSLNGGFVVGRVRPDTELWEPGRVEVPEWMWMALGAPDSGAVMAMEPVGELPVVGRLVLRPRPGAVAMEDPVSLLTVALSDGRWGALSSGMELALDCGVFDVLRLENVVGEEIVAGCILNQDVVLDLEMPVVPVPAPVVASPPTQSVASEPPRLLGGPPPSQPAVLLPTPAGGAGMSFPGMHSTRQPVQSQRRGGFIPFSGTGHQLGNR
jgi:hypothetical protein